MNSKNPTDALLESLDVDRWAAASAFDDARQAVDDPGDFGQIARSVEEALSISASDAEVLTAWNVGIGEPAHAIAAALHSVEDSRASLEEVTPWWLSDAA